MSKRSEARAIAREKAEALVSKMTLEEKASQLRYDALPIERLGIPAYNWWNEGLHGVARAGVATVFPQAIGLAATFDEELLEQEGDVISTEGRAKYNEYAKHEDRDIYKGMTFWSPNVNIFRDPRWGRGHETFGEDPYLTATLGLAFVKGLQGEEGNLKAAACAKHFAVHSGPEAVRHEFDAQANAKDMEETYLPAFEALVKEGDVEAVMGAYNRTNGEACCGSETLQSILRGKWGFKGHFVSDCWAIADFHTRHMVTSTPQESAALALNTGTDLNCGNTYLHMMSAYNQGLVTEEAITEAAVRLYTTKYLLGIIDGSEYDDIPYEAVEAPEHIELSLKAAKESVVLLQNKDNVLPLNLDNIKTIGVIGPNANSRVALIGNYHGTSSKYITVLEGIQDYVGDKARVLFSEGCGLFEEKVENLGLVGDRLSEARTVTEHSDIVILVVGLDETLEGEEGDTGNSYASGDKTDLLLPKSQRDLIEAVVETAAANDKKVILCNMTGSAMDLRFATDNCDAILQLWYPGSRGGQAVAEILFGDVSPSGKLPLTFYKTSEELPAFEDYSMKGRTYKYIEGVPQYPFGYGLTYGDTSVLGASVADKAVKTVGTDGIDADHKYGISLDEKVYEVTLDVEISNDSLTSTEDVLQVYVENVDSPDATPHPILGAMKRVSLAANEKKNVSIKVCDPSFTVVTDEGARTHGTNNYRLYVGFSQPDDRSIELTGHKPAIIDIQF